MSILNHSILTKNYGKLFAKTNSVSANFYIRKFYFYNDNYINYTIIDNVNGNVVKTGVVIHNTDYSINADLSTTSGDCSIYLDVDSTGNECYHFYDWSDNSRLTYIDFDVLPLLKNISMYSYGSPINIVGSLLNLEFFWSYSANYIGLDFSQTTKMTYFRKYGGGGFDMEIDLRNNPNLKTYNSNVYSSLFSVSNHRLLEYLEFKDLVNTNIDSNISTTYLPNLRILNILYTNYQDYDFSTRDLSKLTYLRIKGNVMSNFNELTDLKKLTIQNIGSTSLDIKSIPNLEELYIDAPQLTVLDLTGMTTLKKFNAGSGNQANYGLPLITQIDLTSCTALTHFLLKYVNFQALTQIIIDNGLNTQILNFQRSQAPGTIDVVVDKPTDANNGVAPYLPTVWKEYLNNNSWNFI